MQNNEKNIVQLKILSQSIPPGEVTDLLQLTPTKTWSKGDPRPRTNNPYTNNGWIYELPGDRSAPLEDRLIELCGVLHTVQDRIKQLPRHAEDTLAIHAIQYTYFPRPECYFSARLVTSIAALDVDFWLEIYPLGSSLKEQCYMTSETIIDSIDQNSRFTDCLIDSIHGFS